MKSDIKNQGIKKWVIGLLAGVVVIVLSGFLLLNFVAEPYLQERIESGFANLTENDAVVEIADLDIDLFRMGVTLEGLSLTQGTNAGARLKGHPVYNSTIRSVSVTGLSLWSYLTNGDIILENAVLNRADLFITPDMGDRFQGSNSYDSTSGRSRSVTLNTLQVNDASISLYKKDLSSVRSTIHHLRLNASNLNLSPEVQGPAERYDQFSFTADSVTHVTNSGYYTISTNGISYATNSGSLQAEGVKISPLYAPRELPLEIGHEVDHIDIESGTIQLSGFHIESYLSDNLLRADRLQIDQPSVKISRDKAPPDKPKEERQLFNTKFANLPISIELDTLMVSDGFISYREWKEQQDSSGTVFFDSVDVQMTGVQNTDHNEMIAAKAKTRFMNQSELSVDFKFSLQNSGSQTISGQMNMFDLQTLNPVLTPLAFVEIDSGILHSLRFDFQLDYMSSEGTFVGLYDDFSMRLLSKDDLEQSAGRRIVSFLANQIQIHSNNSEPDPRIGEISFEKEFGQSTVNYWWKSLRSGIKDLVQRI